MGDEVLVTGEARYLQQKHGSERKVLVVDQSGAPRWHVLWEGNPRIFRPKQIGYVRGSKGGRAVYKRPDDPVIELRNAAGFRPYVDWDRMRREFVALCPSQPFTTKPDKLLHLLGPEGIKNVPWRFTGYPARRGELFLKRRERHGHAIIEPFNKPVSPNRDWGWQRYQAVVDATPSVSWMQINPEGSRLLRKVRHEPAATFAVACEILSGASLYLGPEGGLYHAAAALGIPAVAIFGGYIPLSQGYDDMTNFYEDMDGDSPCGQRVPCAHCQKAMELITVERVVEAVERMRA